MAWNEPGGNRNDNDPWGNGGGRGGDQGPPDLDEALRKGGYYPWDFQPLQKASERYMRNHMDLNVLEENQRFPRGE